MKHFIIIFLLCTVVFSCNVKREKEVSVYYDTDSVMQEQKAMLLKKDARILKKAYVESDTSAGVVTPDSAEAWTREFQIFEKISINKPVLKGTYTIKEYNDSNSNLKVREYSSTKKDAEVPSLKLYYLNSLDNLRIIEATHIEDNVIYNSQRKLKLIFDDFTGTPLLRKYLITGQQKMILKDSVQFHIEAEIKLTDAVPSIEN